MSTPIPSLVGRLMFADISLGGRSGSKNSTPASPVLSPIVGASTSQRPVLVIGHPKSSNTVMVLEVY